MVWVLCHIIGNNANVGFKAASKMPDKPLKDIRAWLTERTIDILAGYRKNFSLSHPPGQLVLPENMKEFSMYILSLVKSRAFKGKFWFSATATISIIGIHIY